MFPFPKLPPEGTFICHNTRSRQERGQLARSFQFLSAFDPGIPERRFLLVAWRAVNMMADVDYY